ncbi:hypothetical protein [Dongshaea marina]|uniref:hypothetical protein n=1 Tax=Dongshaea marina TaxID=2047966 RepID=UPI000D3E7850|nr:hypothetical protein [Dongshaea marina]
MKLITNMFLALSVMYAGAATAQWQFFPDANQQLGQAKLHPTSDFETHDLSQCDATHRWTLSKERIGFSQEADVRHYLEKKIEYHHHQATQFANASIHSGQAQYLKAGDTLCVLQTGTLYDQVLDGASHSRYYIFNHTCQ